MKTLFHEDLSKYIQTNLQNPGNMLFVGPPGTGKTTAAWIVGKMIAGDYAEYDIHEFNSSNDRGIDFIRNDLKNLTDSGFGNKKVIILDEADGITYDGQACLRRIMETSPRAVFILTANLESKIHPALISRCHMFRFDKISKEVLKVIGKQIEVDREIIAMDDTCRNQIIDSSNGDIRALTHLYNSFVAGIDIGTTVSKSLLGMGIREFIDMTYKEVPGTIISKLHEEILKTGNSKAMVELAEIDYRCSLATYKVLQLQAGFIRLKALVKGKDA